MRQRIAGYTKSKMVLTRDTFSMGGGVMGRTGGRTGSCFLLGDGTFTPVKVNSFFLSNNSPVRKYLLSD